MNKLLIISMILAGTLLTINSCGEKKVSISYEPSYSAYKTAESPVIDGILTDSCWNDAEVKSLVLCKDGKRPLYPTTFRVTYDDRNLYVGFECQDPDAASTIMEKDGPIYTQEYISVYIDAGSDSKTYAVIDVAPTGAVNDKFVLSYKDGEREKILSDWDCEGLRTSVSVYGGGAQPGTQDRFWTVELALPFEEFLTAPNIPPSTEDKWRINFYRVDLTGREEYSAFVPTGNENFHKPSGFAWLLFDVEK